MDNCSDNEDFCLVVKWIRFVNFYDVVIVVM